MWYLFYLHILKITHLLLDIGEVNPVKIGQHLREKKSKDC